MTSVEQSKLDLIRGISMVLRRMYPRVGLYCGVLSVLLSTALVLLTGTKVNAEADPIESEASWTLAILPDTQHYVDSAANFPNFLAQTEWVKSHADSHNIAFLLHEGDLIENNDALPSDPPNQWQNARLAMDRLHDPNPALSVPYAISPGNHDIGLNGENGTTRDSQFSDVDKFGPGTPYASQPTFGGFFDPARTENTFHEFNAGGQDWLVLALEFGPRADVITWANQVVDTHPDHQVMLVTHAYLDKDNTRLDWVAHGAGTSQGKRNPHNYGVANLPGGVNDGQELWDDLVSEHDNFKYVFSGHVQGAGRLTSFGEDGTVVHQVLADYQDSSGGGNGYMRLLEFKPDGSVQVRTYSPSLDLHNRAFDEEFILTPLNGIDGDLNQDGEPMFEKAAAP